MTSLELTKGSQGLDAPEEVQSPFRLFWQKWRKQKIAFAAGIFILLLFALAIVGPYIVPYDPYEPDYGATLSGPSADHLAGTDEFGRDIFSRVIAGTRISLSVGLTSILSGAIVGTILGIMSGYFGGWLDRIIMRVSDVLLAFPQLLLAIGIVAILGPGLTNAVIAIAIYTVPNFARLIRSVTLEIRQLEFVEAAHAMGGKHLRIMLSHIFPGTFGSLVVFFTLRVGTAIQNAAALSFIGLGASPKTPDWGVMLSMGRDYLGNAPHIILAPGIAIFLTILAFNLLGDGLKDVLDPKAN